MLSLAYVFGVAVTYTIAGILTAMLGKSIQSLLQNFWTILSCSLILALLSLSLFGLYELQLPSSTINKLNKVSSKAKGGTYIGVFLMGAISSLVVSPCVSAPLAGALIYIASTGNLLLGGSALFFLSLGMGLLLVITGVTGGTLFFKAGSWMIAIRYFLGVLMLIVAIWLLSRIVPQFVTNILWAILMTGIGLYMGALEPVKESSAWMKFRKFIAFLILLLGMAIFLNLFFTSHITNTSIPSSGGVAPTISSQQTAKSDIFNVVTTPSELQKFIDQAVKENKPVIIDYYAGWCASCKEMDGTTFSNPEIRQMLKTFVAIRADITKDDENSAALKKKYNIFLPPYIVFLDNNNNEIKQAAIAGKVGPNELLAQMNIAAKAKNSNRQSIEKSPPMMKIKR
jgi:thiol:disulfide interchange protein DsbD